MWLFSPSPPYTPNQTEYLRPWAPSLRSPRPAWGYPLIATSWEKGCVYRYEKLVHHQEERHRDRRRRSRARQDHGAILATSYEGGHFGFRGRSSPCSRLQHSPA